ncbi:MAG TPA: hypothetical protein VKZ41_03545 [Gemmatimonadales bacterium]|nr:hypothetical protein [Gemmatimonadales bacterium]
MHLHFSRNRVRRIVAVVASCNLLVLLCGYAARQLRAMGTWQATELGSMINILSENNVAVWYSGMLFLATALAMVGNFAVEKRSEHSHSRLATSYGWLVCAAAFAFLSLDEMGSLHERVPSGFLPTIDGVEGWPAYLALPLLAMAAFFAAFTWRHLRHRPATASLMALGVLLFLLVPVQEHVEVLLFWEAGTPTRPIWMELLEEGTELFGGLSFLAAALVSITETVAPNGGSRAVQVKLSVPLSLLVIVLLGAGMIASVTFLPTIMNTTDGSDGRGITANWFPSAASFISALLLFGVSREQRRAGMISVAQALGLLGVAHLVLSADHGAAHHFTEVFLEGNATRRRQLDTLVIAGLLLASAWTLNAVRNPTFRVAVAAWTALQLYAFLPGVEQRPVIAFAAYSLILLAIPGLAMAREAGALELAGVSPVGDDVTT